MFCTGKATNVEKNPAPAGTAAAGLYPFSGNVVLSSADFISMYE
jgi:hypothetical protein